MFSRTSLCAILRQRVPWFALFLPPLNIKIDSGCWRLTAALSVETRDFGLWFLIFGLSVPDRTELQNTKAQTTKNKAQSPKTKDQRPPSCYSYLSLYEFHQSET